MYIRTLVYVEGNGGVWKWVGLNVLLQISRQVSCWKGDIWPTCNVPPSLSYKRREDFLKGGSPFCYLFWVLGFRFCQVSLGVYGLVWFRAHMLEGVLFLLYLLCKTTLGAMSPWAPQPAAWQQTVAAIWSVRSNSKPELYISHHIKGCLYLSLSVPVL